jgi:predicted GH43/DUF377 family glycosyl hydrolase
LKYEQDLAGGQPSLMVRRVMERPVVEAGALLGYGPIFNAGLIVQDGIFHLFARGVREEYTPNPGSGPRFLNYVSDILVFTSPDGYGYTFQEVLARSAPAGIHSFEDPRVQRIRSGDRDTVVMTYMNLPSPESDRPWRIGVHQLDYDDGRFVLDEASGRVIGPSDRANKDAVIFNLRDGRVALIHRLHPNMQVAIFETLDELWEAGCSYWDSYLLDLDQYTIIRPAHDALGVGAGAPPIELDGELVLFFHERDRDGHYTAKAALLDAETGKVRAELPTPIMRPELAWERAGDVDNVVFVQGAVARGDGTVYLTYGAADRHVGAAVVDAEALLAALRQAA